MTSEPSGDSNRHPKIAVAEASGRPPYDPEMGHLQFAGRGLTRHSEGCSSAFWVYPESRATCQLQVLIEMIVLSGMVQFHVKVVQYGCTSNFRSLEYIKYFHIPYTFRSNLLNLKLYVPFLRRFKHHAPGLKNDRLKQPCFRDFG